KSNVSFISDLWPLTKFFFVAPETYDKEDKFVRKNWKETTAMEMDELIGVLQSLDDFSVESQKEMIEAWTEARGFKPWNAWRVCLVGTGQGPDMYELAAFLGKEETIKRMENAIAQLK
ncbi:MAG: glutamate--tRNA ligase, partial [Bacteroidaceae bacterium]|nr:glutamate--tRNA ligase [Bacteroidaceae bacterium]